MSHIDVYKFNEVYYQLDIEDGPSHELKDYLSFKMPNFWFYPKYKMGIWDGTISMFDMKTRMLPEGLFKKFIEFCNAFHHTYNLHFNTKDLYNNITIDEIYDYSEELMKNTVFDIYDYQAEATLKAINKKTGIVVSPTASGKSLIIYHLIRYLMDNFNKSKILLIVPSISLVEQMYNDFQSYGWDNCDANVKKLYSGKTYSHSVNKKGDQIPIVLVSTWQSLFRRPDEFFEPFDALLIDEVHGAGSTNKSGSNSVRNVSKKCVNAEYRVGFTGTLPVEVSDKFNIYSFLGPVIFTQDTKELMDRGVLSQMAVANILLQYPEEIIEANKHSSYIGEVQRIEQYADRDKVFSFIINNMGDGENALFLCRHIEHLKRIESYIKKKHGDKYKVYIIYKDVSAEKRECIRQSVDKEENVIIIATFATMSTGVSIKRLHHVVAASSYKSKIKVLQSIGRGLRLHESKDQLIWWDIADDLTWIGERGAHNKNHLYKHFETRLQFYKQQGFEIVNRKLDLKYK